MTKTLTAVFDGHTLLPDSPLDLEPNTRYVITIREFAIPGAEGDAWDVLSTLTGVIDAPVDWAGEHDHYLYGTPKRHPEGKT
ncbi:MAG: hypothetical protein HY782_11955 [Chloroflexi bacterium]|nr:hypothetical protein [Chloroflexota bacterium]